eukprot:CAMPEP_0176450176 /NCGR_PEP_ID=MMETSP0127-20121128/26975_1 /TAXON_ID=938130 /ORGANISM="Platyophrya macrostoma, Strain WH" /LENGTH=500 /DNA_ID=CAMNT_0017837771 /DNA_START=198 /DNA_END=1700 /DNA_ORIENTATION=+
MVWEHVHDEFRSNHVVWRDIFMQTECVASCFASVPHAWAKRLHERRHPDDDDDEGGPLVVVSRDCETEWDMFVAGGTSGLIATPTTTDDAADSTNGSASTFFRHSVPVGFAADQAPHRALAVKRPNSPPPTAVQPSDATEAPHIEDVAVSKQQKSLRLSDYLKSFFCGAVGGMSGCCYSYPLDTVKVRAQALQLSAKSSLSYSRVISSIWQADGVRGFYRGIMTPMMGVACDNAAVFTVNVNVLRMLDAMDPPKPLPLPSSGGEAVVAAEERPPFRHVFVAGLASGTASAMVLTPFELVKCRIQLARLQWEQRHAPNSTSVPTTAAPGASPFAVARGITRANGGVSALFCGLTATMLREVPGTCVWLVTYDTLTKWWSTRSTTKRGEPREPLPVYKTLLCGGVSGCAYWSISFPADVVKTRQQSGLPQFAGKKFWESLATIAKTEGIRGLYRGYGITMVRAFPSNAIVFTAYERASRFWDRMFPPDPSSTTKRKTSGGGH